MKLLLNRGNVIDDWENPEFFAAYNRAYIPGSKTAAFYKKDMYLPVIRQIMNKTVPPMLLKERLMLEARALVFPRYHFLFKPMDRLLQHFIEADLIGYNTKEFNEKNNPKKFEVHKEAFAILTLSELEAGFVVCLVPLALSIFVLAFEWIATLKNLIVVLFFFKKYFEVKEIEQRTYSELMAIKFLKWKKGDQAELSVQMMKLSQIAAEV